MKKILLITAFLGIAFLYTGQACANNLDGGYGYFYASLAPQGAWFELNNGVTVWQPAGVRRDWSPYTDGEWVWTEDGWYWNSYEPFGYITYHYGRWYNDDYYGWIWVPDDQWGPSWVEWRYDDDYIGWAPLPPYAVFSVNVGLHYTYDYHVPYHHWHFVKYRYFCDPYVSNYYIGPQYRERIFEHTKYRNDYGYDRGRVVNRGVDIDYIRKRTGQNIREREVIRTSDPREIERNPGRGNDKIRTFVATREELNRDPGKIEIKRAERNTTLQTSKVQIGRRDEGRGAKRNVVDNEIKSANPNVGRSNEGIRSRGSEVAPQNDNRKTVVPRGQTEERKTVVPRSQTPQENRTVVPRNQQPEQRKTVVPRNQTPENRTVVPRNQTQAEPRKTVVPRSQTQQPRVEQKPRQAEPRQQVERNERRGNDHGNSDNRRRRD